MLLCVLGCAARAAAPVGSAASPASAATLVASPVEAPAPPREDGGDVPPRSSRESACAHPAAPSHPMLAAWCEYTRAIEIDDARPDAWYNLASLYLQSGDIPALECARALYQGFLERAGDDPTLSVQVTNARQHLRTGYTPLTALRAMESLPGGGASPPGVAPPPVGLPIAAPRAPPPRPSLPQCPR